MTRQGYWREKSMSKSFPVGGEVNEETYRKAEKAE